jgi:hypothetical protein
MRDPCTAACLSGSLISAPNARRLHNSARRTGARSPAPLASKPLRICWSHLLDLRGLLPPELEIHKQMILESVVRLYLVPNDAHEIVNGAA